MEAVRVEATNPLQVDAEQPCSPLAEATGDPGVTKDGFRQPTAEELSGLIFGPLHDVRIHTQRLLNQFANLLNRGSCLE